VKLTCFDRGKIPLLKLQEIFAPLTSSLWHLQEAQLMPQQNLNIWYLVNISHMLTKVLPVDNVCKYGKHHTSILWHMEPKSIEFVTMFSCGIHSLSYYLLIMTSFLISKSCTVLTLWHLLNNPVMMQLDTLQHILCQNPSGKLHPFQLQHHLENQPKITRDLLIQYIMLSYMLLSLQTTCQQWTTFN
jgi:hypothetical protein